MVVPGGGGVRGGDDGQGMGSAGMTGTERVVAKRRGTRSSRTDGPRASPSMSISIRSAVRVCLCVRAA